MISKLPCEKCKRLFPWPLLIAGEVCRGCFRFNVEDLLPPGSPAAADPENPKETE